VEVKQFFLRSAEDVTGGEIVFFNVSSKKMRSTRITSAECVIREADIIARWDKRKS